MTNANNDNRTMPLHALAAGESAADVLHMLAEGRSEEAVMTELLIDSGAEVNARNDTGNTPLHTAAWKKMRRLRKR